MAVERIKEFTEVQREPPEFIEPRPPADWPAKGAIKCEDLVIRYAVCCVPVLYMRPAHTVLVAGSSERPSQTEFRGQTWRKNWCTWTDRFRQEYTSALVLPIR